MQYHRLRSGPFGRAHTPAYSRMINITGAVNHHTRHHPGEDPFQTIHCDWGIRDLPPVVSCGASSKKLLRGRGFMFNTRRSAIVCIAQADGVTSPVVGFT